MTAELTKIRREVDKLKKQKEMKIALARTKEEKEKLLIEIQQLDIIKKSPSALKKFGNTYLKGLKITGQTLWRGIKRASRNLDANAPELRQMSAGMTGRPTQQMQPFSPMAEMYVPKPKQQPQPRPRPRPRPKPQHPKIVKKMITPKSKKRKPVKKMKRVSYSKKIKKPKSQLAWDFP